MKKKKTVHLRKIRITSSTKYKKYFANKFPKAYDQFFYSKYSRTKLVYSLMMFFHCMGPHKIFNYFKQLGIIKNYRLFLYKKKSLKSFRLIKKFNKKKKHKKKKKKRVAKILKLLFFKKFLKYSKIFKIKNFNIRQKKKLCLHFSYRHILGLPVRGQRTRTNAKTRKDFRII